MLYPMDRIQFSEKLNKYYILEFHKVPSTHAFYNQGGVVGRQLAEKINVLRVVSSKFSSRLIIIFYSENHPEEPYIVWERERTETTFVSRMMDFDSLQERFLGWNNVDGGGAPSKLLGSVTQKECDSFIHGVLEKVRSAELEPDDSGLGIAKRLLGRTQTRGFDLDLFQYVKTTDEIIFYEFLRNEKRTTTNFQAHPMRYCWTQHNHDNRQKFISLWKAKQDFGARLFLINYSDCEGDGVGVSEVLDLDVNYGFRGELKYNLSFDEFIVWIKRMDSESMQCNDYLGGTCLPKYFGPDFFENWPLSKYRYR